MSQTFAQRQQRDRPITLSIFSPRPIGDLVAIEAPTWLDRELASGTSSAARDSGFGREVRTALAARRQWLIEQQLADPDALYGYLERIPVGLRVDSELSVARARNDLPSTAAAVLEEIAQAWSCGVARFGLYAQGCRGPGRAIRPLSPRFQRSPRRSPSPPSTDADDLILTDQGWTHHRALR